LTWWLADSIWKVLDDAALSDRVGDIGPPIGGETNENRRRFRRRTRRIRPGPAPLRRSRPELPVGGRPRSTRTIPAATNPTPISASTPACPPASTGLAREPAPEAAVIDNWNG
jgi:hypothetical protein